MRPGIVLCKGADCLALGTEGCLELWFSIYRTSEEQEHLLCFPLALLLCSCTTCAERGKV